MYLDLHIHLVPDIDDGPEDMAESIEMVRELMARGWTGAAVTPHIRTDLFPNHPEELRRAAATFSAMLIGEGLEFDVLPGAEHYLDEGVFELLMGGDGVPLGGAGSVYLVEVAMDGPAPALASQIFRMRLAGMTPLIAHPERCQVFEDMEIVARAIEGGAHFQLNLGSLAGLYGRRARSLASRLLAEGFYSVAATDLHDGTTARGQLGRWIELLDRAVGSTLRNQLLGVNPRRLVAGKTIFPVGSPR